jgi:hypothetical protein
VTNVIATPTAEWISRQITQTFPLDGAPHYLIRDRDTSAFATAERSR